MSKLNSDYCMAEGGKLWYNWYQGYNLTEGEERLKHCPYASRVVVVLSSRVGNLRVSSSFPIPHPRCHHHCHHRHHHPSSPPNFISHSHSSTKAGPPISPPITSIQLVQPSIDVLFSSKPEYTPQLFPRTVALLHFSLHRQTLVH